ncbi:hypothetical protein DFJ73DRAFT_255498 [Zopfochytrium polystomum]|nr:hypothetical protein DFJ73DRAFT_255498 [Zopfochytrium polystomum]
MMMASARHENPSCASTSYPADLADLALALALAPASCLEESKHRDEQPAISHPIFCSSAEPPLDGPTAVAEDGFSPSPHQAPPDSHHTDGHQTALDELPTEILEHIMLLVGPKPSNLLPCLLANTRLHHFAARSLFHAIQFESVRQRSAFARSVSMPTLSPCSDIETIDLPETNELHELVGPLAESPPPPPTVASSPSTTRRTVPLNPSVIACTPRAAWTLVSSPPTQGPRRHRREAASSAARPHPSPATPPSTP